MNPWFNLVRKIPLKIKKSLYFKQKMKIIRIIQVMLIKNKKNKMKIKKYVKFVQKKSKKIINVELILVFVPEL